MLHNITAGRRQKRLLLALSFFIFHFSLSTAQISIGGNVYGGGNRGEVEGSTKVTVRAGNIGARPLGEDTPKADDPLGKVFGGARMANVGGNAYVNIDGAQASDYILINQVFGGNDISGHIGTNNNATRTLPAELTSNPDGVDNTWDAYVHISTKHAHYTQEECDAYNTAHNLSPGDEGYRTTSDTKSQKTFIGQAFAGGNGDFTYTDENGNPLRDESDENYIVKNDDKVIAISKTPFNRPELTKTYLDIQGGTIVYAYGGGNNATITKNAVIHVDNPSPVVTHIFVNKETEIEDKNFKEDDYDTVTSENNTVADLLTTARQRDMGVNTVFGKVKSATFQINRLFGGNNKADMDLQPKWNLQSGKIRNLYSGGNRGRMIWHEGLLLEIKPSLANTNPLVIDNVYGGCRMADVHPLLWNNDTKKYDEVTYIDGIVSPYPYKFPNNLAARLIVAGGNVNNVYGGNDVRGKVYFGNAVGIQTSIQGDVYGGGNGNYPYTDIEGLKDSEGYGDFYYDGGIDSLNAIRPNAEQVSIQVRGFENKPTIIGGSIYVGGNCATLQADPGHNYLPNYPITELKIGSYVISDNVFLGNNGTGLVDEETLKYYANAQEDVGTFSTLDFLKNADIFAKYMLSVAMSQVPELKVESMKNGDRVDYIPYTSYIGSLYYGGNRGSMTFSGPININPSAPIYIYNKLVAGSNNANVAATDYNAEFEGGIMGDEIEQSNGYTGDRVTMTLSKIRLKPMRLTCSGDELLSKTSISDALEWNTKESDGTTARPELTTTITEADTGRRLIGGNVYGGCCVSGHVNGNVVINLNGTLANRHEIFDEFEGEEDGDDILYERENPEDFVISNISKRHSGVFLNTQGMDVLGEALSVYGGGKGAGTEIWGSTTVNVNEGYTFQVFGGSESGIIGKSREDRNETVEESTDYLFPGTGKHYFHDPAYSTTVNLNHSELPGDKRDPNKTNDPLADVEFIYGGSFEGPICGNTRVNLGNGRLFNLFAGSCNADILGHTETYVGKWTDAGGNDVTGFPYLRDHIYGGNDLGGKILGVGNFTSRVNEGTLPLVIEKDVDDGTGTATRGDGVKDVLQANAYVEYRQGSMKNIFGGCFGDYDYENDYKDYNIPFLHNSFVNICPIAHQLNRLEKVFGAGEGAPGIREGDKSQDRSYVLIDLPQDTTTFKGTEVFGSGMNNGLGMRLPAETTLASSFNSDNASAIIDLVNGRIHNAYGGSYTEGVTRRTVVNVPTESTIIVDSIYGGAYGTQILPPCDVYESNVNYNNTSEKAVVKGAIFGGNNNERRTLYTHVNINAPVWQNKSKGLTATVYGAGRGIDTWAEYTEVNLNSGARVYKAFGGGEMGHVLNAQSVQEYMKLYQPGPSDEISKKDPYWKDTSKWTVNAQGQRIPINQEEQAKWDKDWANAWTIGDYYSPQKPDGSYDYTGYASNSHTNFDQVEARNELDDKTAAQLDGIKKHNTHVIINEGASVDGYAYGGGFGLTSEPNSGDVYGTTYIALLGGTVARDIYAAGQAGALYNLLGVPNFTATSNAYISGGTVRNVYGGGYQGDVGYHAGDFYTSFVSDRPAQANVVIGKVEGTTFANGVPAITRNVYGGGEGGSVYGTSNVTLNNGMIGYRYKDTSTSGSPKYEYVEELDDQGTNDLELAGNVFGGGYVVNSYVDHTNISMYGGTVRGSLYGGGEVGPIGRGTVRYADTAPSSYTGSDYENLGLKNNNARIFKAGTTHIEMFNGLVKRNVFGGGRGKDSWGGDGRKFMDPKVIAVADWNCKGYIFGQTDVVIHGGEIGTEEGMAEGFGNVFGGGDEGAVYSALEKDNKLIIGQRQSERYNLPFQCYYYEYDGDKYLTNTDGGATNNIFTEDCKVVVEPWLEVTAPNGIKYNNKTYAMGDYIPIDYLNTLGQKDTAPTDWEVVDAGSYTTEADGSITHHERGVIIHNAVFAGGNITTGSSDQGVNTPTVFGNATASIHDVYNRDFITIGTGHTGGLYGDGNLTLVDGYRELNITNYGTDYYNIQDNKKEKISLAEYNVLPPREQAYYEKRFKCKLACEDSEGTTYTPDTEVPEDELLASFLEKNDSPVRVDASGKRIDPNSPGGTAVLTKDEAGNWVPNPDYWVANGVVSVYAGRIMNTIQRADFCGVFGSRMVMKGAPDRVPEEMDYKNYTINRVREVSLNKKKDNDNHDNYFGIYSNVNYLGALTSDVDFHNTKRETSAETAAVSGYGVTGNETFEGWKAAHATERSRNNGTCHNKLALASGVYLEITNEKELTTSSSPARRKAASEVDDKVWGPITGVIELDLINVQPGIGGGFVYAKNIHGVPEDMSADRKTTTLTDLNNGAVTRWDYEYWETDATVATHDQKVYETSGNFINSSVNQPIIDDCYNISGRYDMSDPAKRVPAHYWFIRGQVYVYDQYISAYTGSPNAYSESVEIPITIAAAANGKMTLMDVRPNLYAYYSAPNTKLKDDAKIFVNNKEYKLNDPISYWDWYILPASLQSLFVRETYVTTEACKIGNEVYPAGYVMLPGSATDGYDNLKDNADMEDLTPNDGTDNPVKAVLKIVKDDQGNDIPATDGDGHNIYLAFDDVFRSTNNISHDTGYQLTYRMTNPGVWDTWYTEKTSTDTNSDGKIDITERKKKQAEDASYYDGPTYHPITDGLYGQQEYDLSDIIASDVYTTYGTASQHSGLSLSNQAKFERAYITTDYVEATTINGMEQHMQKGAKLAQSEYSEDSSWPSSLSGKVAPAFVCTKTIELPDEKFIFQGDLMTVTEKNTYISKAGGEETTLGKEIKDNVVEAYYCTSAGLYGGDYYETSKNYRGLAAWSSMSDEDRTKFEFNYDALDLLIDPTYSRAEGKKYQYDSKAATKAAAEGNPATYSLKTPIDYKATYKGTSALKYNDANNAEQTIAVGAELSRTEYESLPNEQRHYAPIEVTEAGTYYVVKETFLHNETPYAAGIALSTIDYGNLSAYEKEHYVSTLEIKPKDLDADGDKYKPLYFCREPYMVNENGSGVSVTGEEITGAVAGGTTYTSSSTDTVPVGLVIKQSKYAQLPNKQLDFSIHGVSPTETSTLYVSRDADIKDLSQEKIITVIYQYDYEESDATANHITPITERHVVNIHLQFKSGIPIVDDILPPDLVLPGTSIVLEEPHVDPQAYQPLGGGWMLFEKESYAENHTNGIEYKPSVTPLYWYQDGYYLAYYAQTVLGKTFSNHVPVKVANYHDLKEVMDDKEHHLHVDYDRTRLKRDSKIYINDYSESNENGLDLFKDFYNLSIGETVTGHSELNISDDTGENIFDKKEYTKGVKAGENLQFYMRTDIDHSSSEWTPIASGTNEPCFNGTFHGDGYTISGLNPASGTTGSLFGRLCGSVYNLGVMGSFTGAGIADTGGGYLESCWVKTSATATGSQPTYAPLPTGQTKPYAVFGNPTDGTGYQVVNSYFWDGNKGIYDTTTADGLTTSGGDRGKAKAMSTKAFYNGELAYDLNNFYLHKRYRDHEKVNGEGTKSYAYLTLDANGKISDNVSTVSYPTTADAQYCDAGYVEERYADGDFRFANHSTNTDSERYYVVTEMKNGVEEVVDDGYAPIWPDDYIFFGQRLNYGHVAGRTHQDVPTAVARDGGRLAQNDNANRVYRAPAYYRSSEMQTAYFNPDAVFAQSKKDDAATLAYKNMTAIDFTDHWFDNKTYKSYSTYKSYDKGTNAGGWFYPPLLDDDGLTGFQNIDLTQNLLVYSAAPGTTTAAEKTGLVVSNYLTDADYGETDDNYHTVAYQTPATIKGHWVEKADGAFTATLDHFLVDKQDFNAPITYSFATGKRMWYQRMPDNYVGQKVNNTFVDNSAGWEAVSLPFKAELVTTDQKGEITHFYGSSWESQNGTHTKVGHEYWLREYKGNVKLKSGETGVYTADFNYPAANSADGLKKYGNTFLWDYYYSYNGYDDRNLDDYQEGDAYNFYYKNTHDMFDYPRLANGVPYIIGFPGERYYEFDLSGNFEVTTAKATQPAKLAQQTITFASQTGATIAISDDETAGVTASSNYTFTPSYMNEVFEAGTEGTYTLNANGSSFDIIPAAAGDNEDPVPDTQVYAFRPYFKNAAGGGSRPVTRSIAFSQNPDADHTPTMQKPGTIVARPVHRMIVVSSTLDYAADVTITNTAGQTLNRFTLQPGEAVETRLNLAGVYIVQSVKAQYTRKMAVR